MSNTSLRVLLVLPMYGGSLPIGRYCRDALAGMGHTVETFEAPDYYPSYKALDSLRVTPDRLDYLQTSYLQVVGQAVWAKTETFEPDLVLAMAQAPMPRQILKRFRREGVPTAMWFVEDHRIFTYWQAFAPYYDIFCVIQKEPFFEKLAAIGQENVLYLPLAADPDVHKPLDLSPADHSTYGSQISFMGAGYPNRRLAFHSMVGRDFKIWGTEWEGDAVIAPFVQMGGARVSTEDCVKIFNATQVNLNLHSSVSANKLVSFGDFVNPRTFELAACGAFQLVDERSLMPELFVPGELATFDSHQDMLDKADHFVAHPDERADYAARAREKVLSRHTYVHRMRSLIDFTAQRLAGWPGERAGSDPFENDYPQELKNEIKMLMNELQLPANSSFEDLVWALRQRQGKLTGLETSILFLDEWKKQYGG